MILTKLKEYAEERMDLPPTMYGENKIAWFIDLTTDGEFEGFICRKSKEAKRGTAMTTPHIGRSSGVKPKLLADTAEYVLGLGRETSKPERVKECHEQFKALIQQCAEETGETIIQTIANFLNSAELEKAKSELLISPITAKQASSLKANQFYGLSLTANNARAVVRDWLETTVPNVEANLKAWFERQRIVDGYGAEYRPLPVYTLAASMYRDVAKEMQPNIPTVLIRNALHGDRLPYDLLNKLVRRNRVERDITYPRAMLIKLIFSSDLKTKTMMTNMEQLNLNPNLEGSDRSAYYCGRLLAVLEAIQRKAIGSVNASLTDRYYGAASSTPANVFGNLMKGSVNHLAKLRKQMPGTYNALERRLEEVTLNLPMFPKTLNPQQQGLFALGYYHQRASDRAAAKAASK
ncbi:MAG: type I-C CRISPR-associated protein Cas8c/Csd1 [Xenococcaceae cyanobacterium MO_188.B32]|nr:type I-C CRISPR-associated protein Cas8c/Csd1 [Xenococcaceae cyanobacterium MO_188.B32]